MIYNGLMLRHAALGLDHGFHLEQQLRVKVDTPCMSIASTGEIKYKVERFRISRYFKNMIPIECNLGSIYTPHTS